MRLEYYINKGASQWHMYFIPPRKLVVLCSYLGGGCLYLKGMQNLKYYGITKSIIHVVVNLFYVFVTSG